MKSKSVMAVAVAALLLSSASVTFAQGQGKKGNFASGPPGTVNFQTYDKGDDCSNDFRNGAVITDVDGEVLVCSKGKWISAGGKERLTDYARCTQSGWGDYPTLGNRRHPNSGNTYVFCFDGKWYVTGKD